MCMYTHTHTHTHTLLPLIIMKELSTHYPRNKRRKISLHIPTSHSPFRPNDKLQYMFFTMLESRVEKAFNTIHWESKLGFPGRSAGKEYTCNAGDPSSIPGSGRSSGEWIGYPLQFAWASVVAQMVKNLQCGRPGFDPWVGKIPWRRACHPTPVFLPGESPRTEEPHGLQSMRSQRATKHSTGRVKYTRKTKGCEVWHNGMCAKSLQPSPTLCDPMGWSPTVSSVQGILQARILEWVTIPSSRGSSQPREQTHVP